MITDAMIPLAPGAASIAGLVGERIDASIDNRITTAEHRLYTDAFHKKLDDDGSWAGEFFGKWYTSAALAFRYRGSDRLRSILDTAAANLRAAQEPSGRLSACSQDFGDWDIWGRKYALLGLISQYEQTGSSESLDAALRAAHAVIDIAGPGRRKLTETGLAILDSLSSSSILEPMALLVRYTGDERIREFCAHLVSLWSEPSAYNAHGMRLVEDALERVAPLLISSPKSYEMMSCFEGLCELYRVSETRRYLDAAVALAERLLDTEIMVVGSGSSHELWCHGTARQTEQLERPMETCVTVTWMKLCYQLLRLTGESRWADQLEITLYNALLGAMLPDGSWWSYFSPLHGSREPSSIQVECVQSSCCVASGPRGLMTVPLWSVMVDEHGPVVNLYAPGTWTIPVGEDVSVTLRQQTDYPATGLVRVQVAQAEPIEYTLSLRIPYWSARTTLAVNGDPVAVATGAYARVRRRWQDGDVIELRLDVRGRVVAAPAAPNQKAVMTGPIVLALDNRLIPETDSGVWLDAGDVRWRSDPAGTLRYALLPMTSAEPSYFDLAPPTVDGDGGWLVYQVPFFKRPNHFFEHEPVSLSMCDYLSAANRFHPENRLRVWLPQPLDLGHGV